MPVKLTKEIVESEPAPDTGATLLFDTEVKGFGVRVFAATNRHPKGARSFFLNYRVGGTERRYKIGRYPEWSVPKARAEAKDLRQRVDRGEDPAQEKRTNQEAPTVAELAQRYKDEYLPGKAPKSQHDDKKHIDKHILPFKTSARAPKMGERKVTEIHSGDMEALHRAITKGGNPTLEIGEWVFPGQRQGQHLKQLRSCWNWARGPRHSGTKQQGKNALVLVHRERKLCQRIARKNAHDFRASGKGARRTLLNKPAAPSPVRIELISASD